MIILTSLVLFNLIVLFIGIKTQFLLYTVPPETQWKKALDEFNSNFETLKKNDISNSYNLGECHIY
ncbi:hypothetical protein [Psychroserpens ponticola]|uniref:Uncharacterized protein n=1 Tax=Psychroserpens ponticola TaxID=2932268 RepID=A0ABY7S1X5_9FLAO|nr:hypothetical protein [Psychroserpens ponticola]WCO03327.1 hypothetical protein MUN68_007445 [Psychroserpens ponticola]